ncbi:GNAT family N-acetyltransferase [Microbulbifer agarilyticus]
MEFSLYTPEARDKIVALFTRVFSASEGEAEGRNIGDLVANLTSTTPADQLIGCVANDDTGIAGAIFFSRFVVPSGQLAYLLSPVAVATESQGIGVGQLLIQFGLDQLRARHVDLVFTYGDPAYYTKTGFMQINDSIVEPPYPLSQPIGWLAQSLAGGAVPAMQGQTKCVAAFANPDYW